MRQPRISAGRAGRPDPQSVLPDETKQVDAFGRARAARSTVLAEDYVELIADLMATAGEVRSVDVARRLGVSHATVVKTVGRLRRDGLVIGRPYRGIFLTKSGLDLAERVVRLLVAVGVPVEDAKADAEGIEHYVSENTLAAFSRFLTERP